MKFQSTPPWKKTFARWYIFLIPIDFTWRKMRNILDAFLEKWQISQKYLSFFYHYRSLVWRLTIIAFPCYQRQYFKDNGLVINWGRRYLDEDASQIYNKFISFFFIRHYHSAQWYSCPLFLLTTNIAYISNFLIWNR